MAVGGWQLVVVGGWWSLGAVVGKKIGLLEDCPGHALDTGQNNENMGQNNENRRNAQERPTEMLHGMHITDTSPFIIG